MGWPQKGDISNEAKQGTFLKSYDTQAEDWLRFPQDSCTLRGQTGDMMAALNRMLWVLSGVGATAGIYVLIQALRKAQTEQDLANCATLALACALVPHCLARAVTESSRKDSGNREV